MSRFNLPEGLSRSDRAHIFGGESECFADWVHDNEEELVAEFLETHESKLLWTTKWVLWLEARWESLKDSSREHDD